MSDEPLLKVRNLSVHYGHGAVVQDISLDVRPGELVAVIGPNGAGKTSTLNGIMGIAATGDGTEIYGPDGSELSGLSTHRRARAGIAYIPEAAGIFISMTVRENLQLATPEGAANGSGFTIESALERWPVLEKRQRNKAAALSGGERQILGIARALCAQPSVLLMDEPSLGLAPKMVNSLFEIVDQMLADGLGLVIVEQSIGPVLARASDVLVMESGRCVRRGSGEELSGDPQILSTYIGG